jgi:hypothetical protein
VKKIGSMMALLLVAGTFQVLASTAAQAATLNVGYTLEGCRLEQGTYDQATATCDDAGYTTGNLGKEWNELDLVPFRVTLDNGTNSAQSGTFAVAGDYVKAAGDAALGKFGWDFVSTLTLNTANSDAGCPTNPTETDVTITPSGSGVGGADQTIYRKVTTSIPANTTCVYDFYMRLAIGAHTFSGSNLQGNLWNENLDSAGVGQKRVSIPVNEIEPQELDKTMTATQDQQQEWTISKLANPTEKDFGDTCLEGNSDPTQTVEVTITWTKGGLVPDGQVAIHTEVTATNPAHRDIQVDVTDVIYNGAAIPANALDTKTEGDVVAAQTSEVVLTHDLLIDAPADPDTLDLNDVATATYTDVIANVPVPGQTTATADATVVPSGTIVNGTVDITDSESITGAGLSFSVADPSVGDFIGYTAGTSVDENDPPVVWHLDGVTDSGQVTFTKTVTFDGPGDASGTLADEANLSVGGNPIVDAVTASTTFTSSTIATLTINKTTSIPVDAPGADFAFDVYEDSGVADDPTTPNVDESLGALVDDVTVHIDTNGTSGSGTLGGLDDGDYIIVETDAAGFTPAPNTPFTVGAGECAVSVDIENTFGPATAEVKKITVPEGSEAGWTFNLYLDSDGNPGPNPASDDTLYSTVTTTDANFISFPDALVDEGDYYVLEEEQHGWTSDGGDAGCTFTVNYPEDADALFSCTFTNTKQTASATVEKVTDPAGNEAGWEFKLYLDNDPDGAGAEDTLISTVVTTGSGATQFLDASNNPIELDEGDYYIVETPQDGWESDGGSTACTFTVEFPGSDGTTYACTFTNTARGTIKVKKTESGTTSNNSFTFELRTGVDIKDPANPLDDDPGTVVPNSTTVITANNQAVQLTGDLVPGDYTICEVVPGPGWTVTFDGNPSYTLVDSLINDRECYDVTVGVAADEQDITVAVDNTPPPGGGQLTIGFWKNHASCKTSSGKQTPVLDQVLATFPIEPGQTTHGFYVGTLYVDTCAEARNLLDKKPAGAVGKGKKAANDALINLAAQYVAAKLNIQGGAGTCAAINTAMASAKTLFEQTGFDGAAATPLTAAQKTQANSLAATIDLYNNGLLC